MQTQPDIPRVKGRAPQTVLACERCNTRRGTEHSRRVNDLYGTDRNRLRAQWGHMLNRMARPFHEPIDLGRVADYGRAMALSA